MNLNLMVGHRPFEEFLHLKFFRNRINHEIEIRFFAQQFLPSNTISTIPKPIEFQSINKTENYKKPVSAKQIVHWTFIDNSEQKILKNLNKLLISFQLRKLTFCGKANKFQGFLAVCDDSCVAIAIQIFRFWDFGPHAIFRVILVLLLVKLRSMNLNDFLWCCEYFNWVFDERLFLEWRQFGWVRTT